MKTIKLFIALILLVLFTFACSENNCIEPSSEEMVPAGVEFKYFFKPIPVTWKAKTILAYEIHGFGFFNTSFEVSKVELFKEDTNGELIASYSGEALEKIYLPQSHSNISKGAVIFLWPDQTEFGELPSVIHHRILLSNGVTEKTYTLDVPINKIEPIIIQSPVKGKNWFCGNGPSNDLFNVHRTSVITIQTLPFISQRFAVDFLRMSDDGYIVNPNADLANIKNEDFYTFGDTLYAVANAKVFSTRDGLDDISPGSFPALNFDHADGNYVTLEIEYNNGVSFDTVYATYAHMVKGSVIPQIGDYVTAGEPIGLLGNSGNTTGPHLHFQITGKGYGVLYSQGLPYEIDSYHLQGYVTNSEQLGEGKAIVTKESRNIKNEMIAMDYLVNF